METSLRSATHSYLQWLPGTDDSEPLLRESAPVREARTDWSLGISESNIRAIKSIALSAIGIGIVTNPFTLVDFVGHVIAPEKAAALLSALVVGGAIGADAEATVKIGLVYTFSLLIPVLMNSKINHAIAFPNIMIIEMMASGMFAHAAKKVIKDVPSTILTPFTCCVLSYSQAQICGFALKSLKDESAFRYPMSIHYAFAAIMFAAISVDLLRKNLTADRLQRIHEREVD